MHVAVKRVWDLMRVLRRKSRNPARFVKNRKCNWPPNGLNVSQDWKLCFWNFTVPVEPVQSSDVVVSDRPFIPPGQAAPGSTSHKQPTGSSHLTGLEEGKKATQPVEAPGALPGR